MRSRAWADQVLAIVAACGLEAAWISLAYVAIQAFASQGSARLSLVAFAAAALVGLLFARWAAPRDVRSYGTIIGVAAVVTALAGWLTPIGGAAESVVANPILVLEQHPGGLLLGLAVVRGAAHVTPEDDERIAEIALGFGLAGVALVWIALAGMGGTKDAWVTEAAFIATLTYIAAGLVSIGLARLAGVQEAAAVGADRRTRLVLLSVVIVLIALALPLASALDVSFDDALRGALGPVADLFLLVLTVLLLPAALVATLLVAAFDLLTGGGPVGRPNPLPDPGAIGDMWRALIGTPGSVLPELGLLPIIIAAVAVVLLARALLSRPRMIDTDGGFEETRQPERPAAIRLPTVRLARPHRSRDPRTASEAYVASLALLRNSDDRARGSTETPAEHAARLPRDADGFALRRLAADYALVEFGRRTLSPAEHRRAIERWRRLRR